LPAAIFPVSRLAIFTSAASSLVPTCGQGRQAGKADKAGHA
jgi:hypothetical protein